LTESEKRDDCKYNSSQTLGKTVNCKQTNLFLGKKEERKHQTCLNLKTAEQWAAKCLPFGDRT